MHKGIFITGTDTGVGKTFIAAGLIRAFRETGINVCPMKPVESGCRIRKGGLLPADTVKLIKASGVDEPLDLINPYRFRQPLAPAVAAELEGVTISRKKIISAYRQLSKKYSITILEGAGGIMVPVYKKYLFIDLAKDLNLPVLIVARPGLGTINHTLLTIEAARSRCLDILGVIFNYAEKTGEGLSEKTNPGVIENLGMVSVLGIVPYTSEESSAQRVFNALAEKILGSIDYD